MAAEAHIIERSGLSQQAAEGTTALVQSDVRKLMMAYIQADPEQVGSAEQALSEWLEPAEDGVAMKMLNLARDWMFFAAIRHHVGWQEEQEKEDDGPCATSQSRLAPFAFAVFGFNKCHFEQ